MQFLDGISLFLLRFLPLINFYFQFSNNLFQFFIASLVLLGFFLRSSAWWRRAVPVARYMNIQRVCIRARSSLVFGPRHVSPQRDNTARMAEVTPGHTAHVRPCHMHTSRTVHTHCIMVHTSEERPLDHRCDLARRCHRGRSPCPTPILTARL